MQIAFPPSRTGAAPTLGRPQLLCAQPTIPMARLSEVSNMRGKTLIPAALFGVAIAALALAQTTSTPSTAPANGETAAPAPPNTQPTAAKPPETSPEAAQGSRGGQGSTQATAPEPSSNPTAATSAP